MNTTLTTLENLIDWYKHNDYSQVAEWTVSKLLEQIEIRLDLLAHALRNSGHIENDIRWQLLSRNKIDLMNMNYSRPASANSMKSEYAELITKAGMVGLASSNSQEHTPIQKDYIVHLPNEERGLVAYLPLSSATDDAILRDLSHLIKQARQRLDIPEPTEPRSNPCRSALKSIIKYKALSYLDICLYNIVEGNLNEHPKKFGHIATALSHHPLSRHTSNEVLPEELRQWNLRFYSCKLLNEDWIRDIMVNIHAEKSLQNSLVGEFMLSRYKLI